MTWYMMEYAEFTDLVLLLFADALNRLLGSDRQELLLSRVVVAVVANHVLRVVSSNNFLLLQDLLVVPIASLH